MYGNAYIDPKERPDLLKDEDPIKLSDFEARINAGEKSAERRYLSCSNKLGWRFVRTRDVKLRTLSQNRRQPRNFDSKKNQVESLTTGETVNVEYVF